MSTNQVSEPADTPSPLANKDDDSWSAISREVDSYVTLLDHKFDGKWDIWRTASKEWCVNLPAYHQTFSGKSLVAVLRDAAAWVPLPVYPRRPRAMSRDLFEIRKSANGKWKVQYDGYDRLFNVETKKKASKYADMVIENNAKNLAAWDEKFRPLTSSKAEGVDFRWEE